MNTDKIINENNMAYKEGDLVKVRTNKCNIHLMEMFGHCQFNPNDISHCDYIALITAIIGNGEHYSVTIFAPHGECYHVIDKDEILGLSSIDELPDDKRELAKRKSPIEDILYISSEHDIPNGLSPTTKGLSLAIVAVNNLHSGGKIRVVEMSPRQFFLRAAIYKSLADDLAQAHLSVERQKELEERKEYLIRWANCLHFEEHYEYHIGIDKSDGDVYDEPKEMSYYIVAVNEDSTKAFVMETRDDQNCFFNYLGPDFKNLYLEANIFRNECDKK